MICRFLLSITVRKILLGETGRRVLLEETLASRSIGTAHQRQWPVDHLRRHQVPNRAIVIRQILLGHADVGPVDAIRMPTCGKASKRLTRCDEYIGELSPFDRQVRLATDRDVSEQELLDFIAGHVLPWEKRHSLAHAALRSIAHED